MDEDDERVRATCGGNFGRLLEVKARYDPDNFFGTNRNDRPVGVREGFAGGSDQSTGTGRRPEHA